MPRCFLLIITLFSISGLAQADYVPKAEQVVDNVYAIIGPLDQRSIENDGLNANYGFIVTTKGVILVDSGASRQGAEKLAAAIAKVTDKPVRWVINTGSQDHRWLGNDYFASKGAVVMALTRTVDAQTQFAEQHMQMLSRFLGASLKGTKPLPAPQLLADNQKILDLGGEVVELRYTDAHFPGDAMVWLPTEKIAITGDLVFVDRLLGVLPSSSVKRGQQAFAALKMLEPKFIVPGHGRVCDLAKAIKETGDYYDFLVNQVGTAALNMESIIDVINRYADLPAFRSLENYDNLHRANMNHTFTEFEND